MNIGTHLVNNFDSGIQGNARVEQNKNKAPVDATRTKLSELKEGSVFKGEIVDINGERTTISLENQETVLAKMKEGVQLNVGDILLFNVEENNSSQVLIKPLFDSLYSAETQTLEKILNGAGLSPTEKNFTAAKELMDAGMPVDKGSLVKVLSQSIKYPDTPMSTLVALNKMNIPVNEANISQYERYQNLNHALSGDIADTAKVMSDFVNQLPATMDGQEMLSFAKDVITLLTSDMPQDESEGAMLQGMGVNEAEVADHEVVQNGMNANSDTTVSDSLDQLKNGELGNRAEDKNNVDSQRDHAATLIEGDRHESAKNIVDNGLTNSLNGGIDESAMASETDGLVTNAEVKETAMKQLQEFGLSKDESQMLVKQTASDFEGLKQLAASKSPTEALMNITEALSRGEVDSQSMKQILSSDGFKKLFSEMIKENWSLDPKQMKDPKEIDNLYQKIAKQSSEFEGMLSAKGGDTQSFQQGSQNMRQNMNFMEQMNQQMIYAQMPLKLSNQQANSELFVYADKRRLVEKKDGISVMLHLDMDHLGMTDVKVTLTGKNVNARFYFNDQQSVDIVADNMEQLEKQLQERGFTLTNEVVKRNNSEPVNQVVNEIIDENAEKSVKRYTFDVKM